MKTTSLQNYLSIVQNAKLRSAVVPVVYVVHGCCCCKMLMSADVTSLMISALLI